MKTTGAYKVWNIIYPVGIYYVVSSLVYFALELFFGTAYESYMLRQMICAAATIPFVWSFYRQDKAIEETVYGKRRIVLKRHAAEEKPADMESATGTVSFVMAAAGGILALAAGAALGVGVNNLIAMTPLIRMSAGFSEANQAFFAGGILFELLGSGLLIPIAEELLYRGVVYKRLRLLMGVWPAIVLSAVIFGAMHFNLVQFFYAGILGIMLAFLVERTGYVCMAALAHMGANVAAIVRQETGWLSFAYEPTAAGIGVTVLCLAMACAALLAVVYLWKRVQGEQDASRDM